MYIISPDSEYKHTQLIVDAAYHLKISEKLSIKPQIYADLVHQDDLIQEAPDNYRNTFVDGRLTREKYTSLNLGTEIQVNYDITERFAMIGGIVYENLSLPDYDVSRNYRVLGLEYMGSFGNYDNYQFGQKDEQRDIFAGYLQDEYKWSKLALTFGFRYDRYNDFGDAFNPRCGIVYKPVELLSFKCLYGEAFRAPTFKEMYDRTNLGNDGVQGNPYLDPEKVKSLEFGSQLNFKKTTFKANLFYNDIYNVIGIYDPDGGGGLGVYENIGDKLNYGFDVELSVQLNEHVAFFINYSSFLTEFEWNYDSELIQSRDKKELSDTDKYMRNIPIERINAGINLTVNQINAFIGANYGSHCEANRRSVLERLRKNIRIDDYFLVNASVTYHATKNLIFQFFVNNLGEDKYSDPNESTNINAFGPEGLIQPSTSYLFSTRYTFF